MHCPHYRLNADSIADRDDVVDDDDDDDNGDDPGVDADIVMDSADE